MICSYILYKISKSFAGNILGLRGSMPETLKGLLEEVLYSYYNCCVILNSFNPLV